MTHDCPDTDRETPFLAVDIDVLDANLRRTADEARRIGIALRPHVKTHKTIEIAQRQLQSGASGITVATVSEAAVFAKRGFADIFIAYPIWPTPNRARRVRELSRITQISMGVDSVVAAESWARELRGADVVALVEIDSGHHRSGVQSTGAPTIARALRTSGLTLGGIFTFPGHAYRPQSRGRAAAEEGMALARSAEAIRGLGWEVSRVSGGSTPSLEYSNPEVLSEVRPGVYALNDAQQWELGVCDPTQIALTAIATVVSCGENSVILDSGSKVLGGDRPAWASGWGRVAEYPVARIIDISEHHAKAAFPPGVPLPPLGSRLRVIPNHVCSAVNLADELVVVSGTTVVDVWLVAARNANS